MGRKVFITSDMSVDERLIEVAGEDPSAALLWPWLLTAFNDWGRAEASPLKLKAKVFPMIATVTPENIKGALETYVKVGLIVCYEVQDKPYMAIPADRWFKWQTHIHKSKRLDDSGSQIPAPPSGDNTNSAQVRETPRESAEVREVPRIIVPSPSPSLTKNICAPDEPDARESGQEETTTNDPPEFEKFWQAYPNSKNKKGAFKKWAATLKRRKDIKPDTLILAAKNYASESRARSPDSHFIMHAATFLGPDERWEEYLTAPPTQEQALDGVQYRDLNDLARRRIAGEGG